MASRAVPSPAAVAASSRILRVLRLALRVWPSSVLRARVRVVRRASNVVRTAPLPAGAACRPFAVPRQSVRPAWMSHRRHRYARDGRERVPAAAAGRRPSACLSSRFARHAHHRDRAGSRHTRRSHSDHAVQASAQPGDAVAAASKSPLRSAMLASTSVDPGPTLALVLSPAERSVKSSMHVGRPPLTAQAGDARAHAVAINCRARPCQHGTVARGRVETDLVPAIPWRASATPVRCAARAVARRPESMRARSKWCSDCSTVACRTRMSSGVGAPVRPARQHGLGTTEVARITVGARAVDQCARHQQSVANIGRVGRPLRPRRIARSRAATRRAKSR